MDLLPVLRLPLAAFPAAEKFWETLLFQFIGLLVLCVAAAVIVALVALTRWLYRNAGHPHRATSAAAAAPHPMPHAPPAEVLAVIAATVHCVFAGRRYRIAAATLLEPDLYWAREGRRSILSSHKTR